MAIAWIALAALAGVFDTLYNLFSRKFLNASHNPLRYAWWFSFFRTVFFLPVLIFSRHGLYFDKSQIIMLASLGILNVLNIFLFMKMHELTHLSLSQIIVKLRLIWVPIITFIFLAEKLESSNYLGIALLFLAVSLLASPKRLMFDKSVSFAFLFSVITSIVTVLIGKASTFTTTPTIIVAMSFPTVIALPFVVTDSKKQLFYNWTAAIFPTLMLALLSVLLLYFLILAFDSGGPIGKVNAIFQSMTMLSVALGIFVLQERDLVARKLVGSALALVGILLII